VCFFFLSKDSKYLILVQLDILEQTQNQQKMRRIAPSNNGFGGMERRGGISL
jgi:hypothetical protein